MFTNNKSFYPTPQALASKMVWKIKKLPGKVLEPSAGKGDLIDALASRFDSRYNTPDVLAIEIDPLLQGALRAKEIKLIDSDFLAYTGPDKWDVIIANPPFEDGDKHLLKALDIMYRGQIIFLLNAETLKNPHTNTRKDLVRRLDELGAEIEYIQNAFTSAERKTGVEVALVNVMIERQVEDDLFVGVTDMVEPTTEAFEEKYEVATGRSIEDLVAEYNRAVDVGTETILSFYRNYRHISKYLTLNDVGGKLQQGHSAKDLTGKLQNAINVLLRDVRTDFWRKTLDLKEVRSRMTQKKAAEFEDGLKRQCFMDFTESNIRQFVLNLIGGYEQTLTDAVLDIFDMFTIRHSWHENLETKNIHYFNGWKTNQAYKVGKRVVIPVRASYGMPFFDAWRGWSLNSGAYDVLSDIDKVFNFFDGNEEHESLPEAVTRVFKEGDNSGESTYFKFTCHKKGTIHLTFLNDDILRRFNVVACRGKGWLPHDYGAKAYQGMAPAEKAVVEAFEGQKSYSNSLGLPLFSASSSVPRIELKKAA